MFKDTYLSYILLLETIPIESDKNVLGIKVKHLADFDKKE